MLSGRGWEKIVAGTVLWPSASENTTVLGLRHTECAYYCDFFTASERNLLLETAFMRSDRMNPVTTSDSFTGWKRRAIARDARMEQLYDLRPQRPGYRLHRLEVFNWGTFDSTDGHVFRFEPEGRTALMVGHNGSGKSTLVDAVLTLLVEPRTRNYNVAAGARKTERTEKSYIRGAFARTSDETHATIVKYLRPKATNWTAIAAVFRDAQLDRAFTLCQVMHLTSDDAADKVFAISDGARDLKSDLSGLRSSDAIRGHLNHLGYDTTKKYVQYHGWFAKRTKMRAKAMDMFNQTVAVKDIQSLNKFIRDHMLEAHDWREKVQRLLKHFNDLSVAHQELVRARKAEELLQPVETRGLKYREQAEALDECERRLAAAETFFREETVRLFEPEIARHEAELQRTIAAIQRYGQELKAIAEKIRQLANEIDDAGGERLKKLPGLIEIEQAKLARKKDASQRYHALLKKSQIHDVIESKEQFDAAREQLQTLAKTTEQRFAEANDVYEELIGRRGEMRRRLHDERAELEILNHRQTNLPPRFASLRSRICEDLQLAEDVLPFAAELISVQPEQRRWEASAEMVLRSFALSLLVPERYYRRVRTYVEQNRMLDGRGEGQRLDYLRVGKGAAETGDRLHEQSLVRKLKFRDRHPLAAWVRGEIGRRFDFRCCDSIEEFNDTTRLAMTENRHVKIGTDQHKKDDRTRTVDPRYFVLGWDNREKKRRIAESIRGLEAETAKIEQAIAARTRELDDLRAIRDAAAEAMRTEDFDTIDVRRHQAEIDALEQEKQELEQSNDAVKALKQRLTKAEADQNGLNQLRDKSLEDKALLTKQIDDGKRLVQNARSMVAAAKEAGEYDGHATMFDAIRQSLGEPPLSAADVFDREEAWKAEAKGLAQRLREPLQQLGEKLVEAMSRFLREFKEEQTDLDASVHSLDSFFGLLEQIRQEDLPRHEKKFKERLNDRVSQEVAPFHGALRQECKHIEQKIEMLNKALSQLEYREGTEQHEGTHMRLEPRPVQDREIEEFRRALRECLDESLENTSEANEARFLRIQTLVERLADNEKTRWRDKVIDVRNWYNFAAREIERESGRTRSLHEGSSGQSGGEKAKLAFTILVAAIAYQYDIDPEGRTPGRFHFVVVDEMFSKIDDQNAHYALRLFEQFGLQLLIVAPLDAKARVTESFVDSYLHVVKDDVTNRSQMYSMNAREYEEVVKGVVGNGAPKMGR